MALPAYALVTLEQAKSRLGVTDTARDSVLEGLIGEVSRLVLKHTGREYAPATNAAARIVSLRDGASIIDLYPYEARAVTAIVLNPDEDTERVLTADEWQLQPVVAPDGVYDRIRLAFAVAASRFELTPVRVTGDWGWSSVPEDVRGWVLEMVEDRWKQDHAFYADADGFIGDAPSGGSGGPVTIPFRIRDEMESAKRVRLGSV